MLGFLRDREQEFRHARRTFEARRAALLRTHPGQHVAIRGDEVIAATTELNALFDAVRQARPDVFVGDYTRFEVIDADEEEARLRDATDDTWSLLAEPWLDTDMPQERWRARRILQARGIAGWRLRGYRFAAALGFCWNIVRGEWAGMDYDDVLLGWCWSLTLVLSLVVGMFAGKGFGVLAFAIGFILAPRVVDLALRRGRRGSVATRTGDPP
jgi:hypothetical protein